MVQPLLSGKRPWTIRKASPHQTRLQEQFKVVRCRCQDIPEYQDTGKFWSQLKGLKMMKVRFAWMFQVFPNHRVSPAILQCQNIGKSWDWWWSPQWIIIVPYVNIWGSRNPILYSLTNCGRQQLGPVPAGLSPAKDYMDWPEGVKWWKSHGEMDWNGENQHAFWYH